MINTLWENVFKKAEQERNITRILSENILFRDLTPKELKFVEQIVHERQYRKGEFVFQQGEVGVGMYIIAKGAIDISLFDNHPIASENAKHIFVTRLESGDFFGELSLVEDNGRRSASAIAAEDTILIGFFKPDLMEILERSPTSGIKIVFRLSEVLGRRLKETTDKISQLRKEIIGLQNTNK
ncbi:MAG: Crp/Fnr family transcriptional regulator [Bdellovibrionales bacterium]